MKRYLLFGGDRFYARGGWTDFRGSFDSVDNAVNEAATLEETCNIEWWHVVDIESGEIVQVGEYQQGFG